MSNYETHIAVSFGDGADDSTVSNLLGVLMDRRYGDGYVVEINGVTARLEEVSRDGVTYQPLDNEELEPIGELATIPLFEPFELHIY